MRRGSHGWLVTVALVAGCGFRRTNPEPAPQDTPPLLPDGTMLGQFGAPVRIAELASAATDDDPTLTADMLEICFDSLRIGGGGGPNDGDIWCARRASTQVAWGMPIALDALNQLSTETTPQLSGDGLKLYFSSDRAGDFSIYSSTRATRASQWTTPVIEIELSTARGDFGATISPSGLRAVLFSNRLATDDDLYESTRASQDQRWSTPRALSSLNTMANEQGTFLFDDRTLYFSSLRDAHYELYVTTRTSPDAAFGAPQRLSELSSPKDDNDPWVSPDQRTIVFTSDRGGNLDFYIATR